jgi:hypothetical protein
MSTWMLFSPSIAGRIPASICDLHRHERVSELMRKAPDPGVID